MLAAQLASAAQEEGMTFYLQLIRGTDDDAPPTPQARLVGPKLGRRLQMFRWKNYWEIKRQTVHIKVGAKTRQRMTPNREVEIALTTPHDMTVCIFTDGHLSRKRTQAALAAFYIAGGDDAAAQPWFIVVRRDMPQPSD